MEHFARLGVHLDGWPDDGGAARPVPRVVAPADLDDIRALGQECRSALAINGRGVKLRQFGCSAGPLAA
jgi:hypothetical protein